MKKTIILAIAMILAVTLGVAYANDEGGKMSFNGITDFTSRSYDSLSDISSAGPGATYSAAVESSSAGGMRSDAPDTESYNGVTDFTGRSYDALSDLNGTAAAMHGAYVESSSAGGFRAEEPGIDPSNGITNFSGKSYDSISDVDR